MFDPLVYLPFRQQAVDHVWFFARTRVPPDRLAAAVRSDIQNLDPDLYIWRLSTLEASLEFASDQNAVLSPIFAAIALLLASIGLYAVVAHSVNARSGILMRVVEFADGAVLTRSTGTG